MKDIKRRDIHLKKKKNHNCRNQAKGAFGHRVKVRATSSQLSILLESRIMDIQIFWRVFYTGELRLLWEHKKLPHSLLKFFMKMNAQTYSMGNYQSITRTKFKWEDGKFHFKLIATTVINISSVQFSSVTQSCLTLCDPMDCSTPGLPVYRQLPEFTQTHVPWVSDAIQPSHPLSSPSPPAFNLPQHQGVFQWVSSSNKVAEVLEFQLQLLSFQWIVRTDFL